jgi:hypothetical protein
MPESNKDQLVEFTARNTYLTCDQGFQRVGAHTENTKRLGQGGGDKVQS